ncbi:arf-GAP domain and FG repeat-containing protein 1a isoform X9 [Poecilia reticulata]|uniref:arf-GAP domain and FG repeat-containing protein 1a isoform X9 n=1 Tax=Poecilia reticulata TaxID=8081 RepID=UPI0004A2AD29|nr:PREDICTED: arf-GAP domain and FG repeat-containing protein 1 isoform X9 [Poecilia reticulata]XP_008423609.1 PREDICTED: arf-GAP domain and FG repeat-containing protein 1 isoform X9 [Poecilia reticulata]
MAASAKRKQEEKHLKMLREMTSLSPNRKCFDCDQRGPTYANMTVGSFVCTSCSGILRGLNPPHRVKSISMTTFTQQEIEFLQKHGNEVCKQIWLGLYDDRTSSVPDFREPQKVKEFLQEKYEKKRWYVPPEQAKVVASVHASISGSSNSSTNSTPEVRPLKSLLGDSAPSLHLTKNTPPNQSPVVSRGQHHQQQFHEKKFDLLSDLGGDIFAAPANVNSAPGSGFANFAHFNSHTTPAAAQNVSAGAGFANFDAFGNTPAPQASFQPPNTAFAVLSSSRSVGEFTAALPLQSSHSSASGGLANANFANFDNFPKSCSADFGSFSSSSQSNSTRADKDVVQSTNVLVDRYAALADLDNVFSSAKTEEGGGIAGGVSSAAAAAASAGVAGLPQKQSAGIAAGDRYAALAELDTVFSSSAPATSVYNTSSTSQGNVFGSETVASAQAQQAMPGMPQGFGAAPSTNPFVAAGVAPAAAPTNPFQCNGRAANMAAAAAGGNLAKKQTQEGNVFYKNKRPCSSPLRLSSFNF